MPLRATGIYSRSCHHPSYRGPLPTALFPLRLSPGSLPSGLAPGDSHAWNWIRTDALPAAQGGAPPSLDLASFLPQERGRLVSFSGRLHGRHLCRLSPDAGWSRGSIDVLRAAMCHARPHGPCGHAHACLLLGFASFTSPAKLKIGSTTDPHVRLKEDVPTNIIFLYLIRLFLYL